MMAIEGPYIAAIVARMPAAAHSLAAYGVATSLAWLVESPIMMLLSASTALVRDRASYLALRRFAFLLNAAVTLGMIVLALPPVFRFVGETLIGLPPDISRLAHISICGAHATRGVPHSCAVGKGGAIALRVDGADIAAILGYEESKVRSGGFIESK